MPVVEGILTAFEGALVQSTPEGVNVKQSPSSERAHILKKCVSAV